VTFTNTIIH